MKKIAVSITLLLTLISFSCATLQEDVYVNSAADSVVYSSIEEYEYSFITIDNNFHTGKTTSVAEIKGLISGIDAYVESTFMEPQLKARLYALQGLLYLFSGKTSKAQDLYKTAKAAQSGDSYVLLLESRLEKTTEDQLLKISDLLRIAPDDPILIMEKAKLQNKLKQYAQAVASVDEAFLLFDKNSMTTYRDAYSELQTVIWQMYQLADTETDSDEINPLKEISVTEMIKITQDKTTLLNFFTGGTTMKPAELAKRLEKNGYISEEFSKSKTVTKGQCAVFIWTLFVQNSQKNLQIDKYSQAYSKFTDPVSPINDVFIEDEYFDAVLGLIENEIMDLPDGSNFLPETTVTALDFVTWIKLCENKIH